MQCLACLFRNPQVNRAYWWEHPGRVVRPISLQLGRPGSVPAESGVQTLPMFGSNAPNYCFQFWEALLPNITSDVGRTASDQWLPSHPALLLEGCGQWH